MKAAVRPRAIPDLRHRAQDALGGLDIGLEVVIALQHVIVDASRSGPADIDPSWRTRDWRTRDLSHHASPSTGPDGQLPARTAIRVAHESYIPNVSVRFRANLPPYPVMRNIAGKAAKASITRVAHVTTCVLRRA